MIANMRKTTGFSGFRQIKPFASGAVRRGSKWVSKDALLLKEAARTDDPLEWINPFCFRAPLAPDAAVGNASYGRGT